MNESFINLYDAAPTASSGGGAALAASNHFTVSTGASGSCYVPIYPMPTYPTYPSTFVSVPSYPVMHPHACPICEGRQTVEASFYRDVAADKGPQTCRACKGNGLVYTP